MKDQIMFVGGGMSFRDRAQAEKYFRSVDVEVSWPEKDWKKWLAWSLEDSYEFIKFQQPVWDNADYGFWKIIFEKYFAKFNDKNLTIICHSLGTIFLMKYLVENGFVKKIKQLHLVAPIVDNKFQPVDDVEDCATFTFDIDKLGDIKKYCEEIHIWHSRDDSMCSFANAEYINEKVSGSILHDFSDRGHFFQSTFFELFDVLRKDK